MQIHKFSYKPKSQSISHMEVHREEGHQVAVYHMHDHEELVLVDSAGTCRFVNNGSSVVLETPAIVINRAGTYHETETVLQGDYHSRVVFFHPQNLQELPEEMACKELFANDMLLLRLTEEQLDSFSELLDLLEKRPMEQKRLLLLCILSQLRQLIRSGAQPLTTNAHQTYIFDVIEAIQATHRQCTVAELAERFHVSGSKLKTDFKDITGVSVAVFSRRVRLQKAQALLDSTQLELSQITEKCGFSDESYFIESFRKTFGITPGAYRRKRQRKMDIQEP